MPRYDYLCPNCKHEFEIRQSFSSEPVAPCPKCQTGARRVIHSVPIVFKGSGFYVNDYGKGRGSTTAGPEPKKSKDGSESESKADSKAESKADSKVESKASSGKDESS